MRLLKNLSLFPMHARFANVMTGVGSYWHRGVERCLTNSAGILKIVNGGDDEMHRYGHTIFTGRPGLGNEVIGFITRSMSEYRMLKLQHDSSLHSNMLEKPSTIGHRLGNSIRQEHSVSREWLAKRWADEKRKKDIMRKRKRRYAQRVETKEPMIDSSFKFPFIQSFFTRSIPSEQGWQTNEASMQPPMSQYEEGLLYPRTPEEVKLAPLLARSNLLITRDIEWANIMFAFEQENRYAMMDPCYPQSPVGFIREQSNVLTRQLLRTRRPFIAHITDAMGNEIFRVRRPFWWITSTIYAEVDGKEIGVVCRRWHLWRRIYDLYFGNKQFAVVENPGLWNWTFTLKDEDDNVLAQIDRDWRGFGFELFTDAGQYAIRFGNTYSSPKIGLASAVQELVVNRPLTLSERAVAVALAISLDNDFFSRTAGGWGLPIFVAEATPKSVLRVMGMKGLTLYHLKSHLQKYRLGRQSRKETGLDGIKDGKPSKASFNSSASSTVSSGNTEGEFQNFQLTEELRYQIEVQTKLHEQLEVQKKLQSRIEAQGKYLQAILEKAQKSLSFDTKNMEATRAQLKDFNQALSGLMDNVNQFCVAKDDAAELDKLTAINTSSTNSQNLKFASRRGSLLLDLNLKENQDFFTGNIGTDLDPHIIMQS